MGQVLTGQDVMEMNIIELNYIRYGRFLERNNIDSNDHSDNYVRFLKEEYEDKLKEEDEEIRELCLENNMAISQRDKEYEEFLNFIVENGKDGWDNDIAIYNKEDYDSGCFDKVIYCKADDIYDVIEIDIWEFEKYFISTTYIEKLDIYRVIIKLDGMDKEIVVHGV